jgi:hypothetical protein
LDEKSEKSDEGELGQIRECLEEQVGPIQKCLEVGQIENVFRSDKSKMSCGTVMSARNRVSRKA